MKNLADEAIQDIYINKEYSKLKENLEAIVVLAFESIKKEDRYVATHIDKQKIDNELHTNKYKRISYSVEHDSIKSDTNKVTFVYCKIVTSSLLGITNFDETVSCKKSYKQVTIEYDKDSVKIDGYVFDTNSMLGLIATSLFYTFNNSVNKLSLLERINEKTSRETKRVAESIKCLVEYNLIGEGGIDLYDLYNKQNISIKELMEHLGNSFDILASTVINVKIKDPNEPVYIFAFRENKFKTFALNDINNPIFIWY